MYNRGTTARVVPEGVRVVPEGGYLLFGYTRESNEPSYKDDIYVVRVDEQGNELWAKAYGEIGYGDHVNLIAVSPGNGFIISGRTERESYQEFFLANFDMEGNQQWRKIIGGGEEYNEIGNKLHILPGEGFIMARSKGKEWYGEGIIFTKYDQEGNEIWYKTFADGTGKFNGLEYIPDEGFLLYK